MRMLARTKYIHILQGGLYCPQKPKKCKKNGGFSFLHQILHTRRIDSSVLMGVQNSAKRDQGHAPPKILYQNGANWRILSVPNALLTI